MVQQCFNPQWIERLRYDPAKAPPSGRMEIEDAHCPGLLLRVTPRGVKSFSVIYRVPGEGGVNASGRLLAGQQHRITLGPTPPLTLTDAREKAREHLRAASEGRDPRPTLREQHIVRHTNTFDVVLTRFLEREIKPKVSAWRNVERVLKHHVEPHWASTPVRDIRRSDVHERLDALVEAGKVGTAREVRKHLSRFFNWAVDRELITSSPVHELRRSDLEPNQEAGRELTDHELRAIWQAAEQVAYPFGSLFQLLMLTGQRRGEWAEAKRSEFDIEKRRLEVPRVRFKGRRDHIVPLAPRVWEIVAALPRWESDDSYILSSRAGKRPVSGFSKAKEEINDVALKLLRKNDPNACLANYRIHDLRVTCETRLARLGFNQEVRDAVLGHAKAGLQKTYNKYEYLDEKLAALTAYADHISQVVR
jgi:integrase